MKANFCEKGDSITYALLILFRTQKNKIDVVVMCGVVQKKAGNAVNLSYIHFGGGEQHPLFVYLLSLKTNIQTEKGQFWLSVCLFVETKSRFGPRTANSRFWR